jgi:hypothetical protein
MPDVNRMCPAIVECAIVDGAVAENSPENLLVLSRRPAAPPAGDARPARVGHTGMCVSTVSFVEPAARFHLFPVFRCDGEDVPVDTVLDGLRAAVELHPPVICLPWTISQTRLAADFEAACAAADAAGSIVVAAWAPDVEKPIPASFDTVIAALGRRYDPACSFAWRDEPAAVLAALGSSRTTALVCGLAAAFVRANGPRGRAAFVDTLRGLQPVPASPIENDPRFPRGFDPSLLVSDVAAAYRRALGIGGPS